MRTIKKFDCVKMKDRAQERRARDLHGLTPEERLEYYRQQHQLLLDRQAKLQTNDRKPSAD
jgi:hypothetical protein